MCACVRACVRAGVCVCVGAGGRTCVRPARARGVRVCVLSLMSILVFRMKYLKDKPVNSLRDEQFLKLYMAEEEKLLELDIGSKITNYSGQNYVDEAKGLYARVRPGVRLSLEDRCPARARTDMCTSVRCVATTALTAGALPMISSFECKNGASCRALKS